MTADFKVGDRIKDNDPRMGPRVLVVIGVTDTHVKASPGGLSIWISRIRKDRIHTDGKPRKSGFTLLKDEA